MSTLFGIPVNGLAVGLAIALGVVLAAVAVLALRNRIFLRLGVRNASRRRGRSVLIVAGLMLGTAIITAALATGDTMSQTIRSSAVAALGQTDEIVAAKGVGAALSTTDATGAKFFPEAYAARVAAATRASGLVDGVAPVVVEPVAIQDVTSRQNEPAVTLFASDPARLHGFGDIRSDGRTVSLSGLAPGEIYLNEDGARKLDARQGDTLRVLAGDAVTTVRAKAIVRYQGGATDGAGILMPLSHAQRFLGKPGLVRAIFVSNTGGASSTAVTRLLKPTVDKLGLETDKTKQKAVEEADKAGASFMSLFTTFGSFSIAAGILLIFLIFVMLAAERRGELGIARAVGTRRRHLVQMFVYEGIAYDLVAALVGVLLGAAVAYGMVIALAHAFANLSDLTISYSVGAASIVIGYALGVLLTFAVVAVSAWRVSRMNISTAIRNLPEPPAARARKRRWLRPLVGIAVGSLIAFAGISGQDAVVLGVGVAVVIISLVPIVRLIGVPDRVAKTVAGLLLIVWFVLPISRWLFGDLKVNFGVFVFGGLMIVVGATWTIMYNADILLGAVAATFSRIGGLAPVLRMAIAYPLRSLFRTGVTLAMFTLVVFTLVVGATTTGSFTNAYNDAQKFGGGFDVRAQTSAAAPISNMRAALTRHGLDPADFRFVSSESTLPVRVHQLGVDAKGVDYAVIGADATFLRRARYGLSTRARGYRSDAAVWDALRTRPNLAVVDQYAVPRKANWGTPPAAFQLSGFYLEDKSFAPVKIAVRDPQTDKRLVLTVVGVLADSAPEFMKGIWTSQASLGPVFGDRVAPTTHLFALGGGGDPGQTAKRLERAFLANGMQADSLDKLRRDTVGANLTFNRLIMGFMGLGLIVGVAALGVITARAVVERRQQIGVLRAIGFNKRMVQLSFIVESSFIALTSIVVGLGLGLAVAYNVVVDSRRSPSWAGMDFSVPWTTLLIIFLVVYLVALATTLAPARRAARVYPAQALRYQ